jgi:parallel beta-helix repeat protein
MTASDQTLLVSLLACAALLGGCGGGSGTAAATAATTAAPAASAASPVASAPTPAASAPAPAASAPAAVAPLAYVVGPSTSALPSGAVHVDRLVEVPWASLTPGSSVVVAPGVYEGPVTITSQGTAAQPITVAAQDPANLPIVTDAFDFRNAAWVQVSSVVVQQPSVAGFVIRDASHHITVADSTVRKGPTGVEVTSGAGTGIQLLRNRVEQVDTNGIGIDGINADPADRSVIQGNTIVGSGHHGIELRGSNYRVERNTVSQSGQAIGGTSGIHIYSAKPGDGTGAGNVVRYNYSYLNADTKEGDGNGIQIDQWCDGNTVAFNVVWANDGAGIIVFDGNKNQIYGNTAGSNGRNSGGTHLSLGEIIIDSSGDANATGRPANNSVYDNVLVATQATVPALYIDSRSVAVGSNSVGPNLLFNTTSGVALRWTDDQYWSTAAQVNTATGRSGNLVLLPSFANSADPLSDGLRLTAHPGANGVDLTGQTDLLGHTAQTTDTGWSYFGAYFTAP